jgi:hypothetical protein
LKRDLPGFRYWKLPENQSVDRLKIGLKMVDSGRGPL